ncbi:ADP-ribosylation/Crystallin J1 [Mahella australiensis 50-1 BON]|uniref:ADP-ribosylation/Crystallin J1 n=2 Tax=Mahella TaxID=252965 RepID=F3ZW12_MAHA5|nr:ADP-ribosylation/Crystallin J1 [Mahella australiensis 50-1 BON]
MGAVKLSWKDYYDKVYACWLGKNCGGTLGTPLERAYGQEEMFDVWWYPQLQEGGMPNDDLEIQLIWLKALEERGLGIKARDLAEYWLDCVQYNFDEYGLHKTNLRQGLLPPVSGFYNNWFKDCMGCPIRSEIWACIAPGRPDIAVRYAYEDAIVDHAGGESVYGEMFNAAVEAAAFVVNDRDKLLDIGLSYIPTSSQTALAIRSAIEAYKSGMDWKEARNYVLHKCYSPIAQYSPVNLGFQTIGWLYGEDFADAICKAVNCGYDTDCTGATLGSILGIMYGTKIIPQEWSAPLSDTITTNASWGGIMNLEEPKNLDELTKRTCDIGKKVLAYNKTEIEVNESITDLQHVDTGALYAPDEVRELWSLSPMQVDFDITTIKASIDYIDQPVIKAGESKGIKLTLENPRPMDLTAVVTINMPKGWACGPACTKSVNIPSRGKSEAIWHITADDVRLIEQSNRGSIHIEINGRPQGEDIPVVLLGCKRWLISPVDAAFNPDGDDVKQWQVVDFIDNALVVEPYFNGKSGSIYLCHYVYSPDDRTAHVGVPSNCPMELWANGIKVHEVEQKRIPRPNYSGDGASYVDVSIKQGWNQFIVKLTRQNEPVDAYFTLSTGHPYYHGMSDVIECRLPWE